MAEVATSGDDTPSPDSSTLIGRQEAVAKTILREALLANYFGVLGLQQPLPDALGRAQWTGTDDDVARAFRKRSIYVHPDKSKIAEARNAFEELCKAYRMLRTEISRAKILRELPKTYWEKSCTAGDKKSEVVDIYTQFTPKDRRELQRKEADSFADEIKHQMARKRHRAQALTQMQEEEELEREKRAAIELKEKQLKLRKEAELQKDNEEKEEKEKEDAKREIRKKTANRKRRAFVIKKVDQSSNS